jgi:Uma2 family endonuclease
MATAPTSRVYVAEDLESLPDGDRYEIIEGVLQERIMSSLSSHIAMVVGFLLQTWSRNGHPGRVMGSDGGYKIFPWTTGDVRMPDVSYISAGRVKKFPARGWLDIPPDLAVEVVSPTDSATTVHNKAVDYIRAGVPLVWVIFPDRRTVEVLRAQEPLRQVFQESDTLTGGEILPGFSVPVAELFAGLNDED